MGRKARPKPKRLAEKLLRIREALGVSQSEMFRRLDVDEFSEVKRISDYETGKNEPPLPVLLAYARLAGVCVDTLIDDAADLPSKLPAKRKHSHS
jgi:transcriptional regulator with XRE-family HTH domain